MAFAIAGQVVPLTLQRGPARSESASFKGRVWIADDGTIAAVTSSRQKTPAGFDGVPVVDAGTSLVLPGFIDLHSHLAYAPLPLWVEPDRTVPFAHHDIWPSQSTYASSVTWPAYAFVTACPAELLAYAEVRALIGGTTSIQGSPPSNRPLDGWLIRNVEDERLDNTLPSTRILASTLTLKPEQLGARANHMRNGSAFIYHCAEGQPGSIVGREYQALRMAGCLQHQLVAIHTNALAADAYASWTKAGTIVWSPFSNLWLYGDTTDVPGALAQGLRVCIGSDWGPSGTRNVLGELKIAHLVSERRGWGLTPFELVRMITCAPGDALAAAWGRQVGRLQPGALADVTVIRSTARADPFKTVLNATERDVRLVVVGGRPLFGEGEMMEAAGAAPTSVLKVGGERRRLAMRRLGEGGGAWSFPEVLERMEQVRSDPSGEIERARSRAFASALAGRPPELRLALDMPTGKVPIGGLPKDLSRISVPPIQPIEHEPAFFQAIAGRGFHGGLLDGLARFYG
jgi:5-methylthioadenosine/S-adenosylhomocysteine deaminase